MEWAIGKGYDLFRPDTGKLIVPGEKISWDQHIHAAGEEITAGSEIGIWFYKKGEEPKKRSYLIGFTGIRGGRESLDIPPNSFAQTEGFTALKENTLIENFQPHFHLRGKSMQVEAILPDGSSRILSYVGDFNFNWMTNYIYDDDAAPLLPKGTVIHVSAWYDNTKGNKNNPDPEQWVGYGDRTVDEMAHAWMNVVYLSDAEYQQMLTDRKTKLTKVTTGQNSMRGLRRLCIVAALTSHVFLLGQALPEPRKQFGASVTGAFEGWFENGDGTQGFLVGYYNRNTQEELDIPIGPNNRIEPGGPDMGQPTHFLPSRQFGMFAIPVPKGFTPEDKFTWTIFANGKYTSIPLRLHPDYVISPFSEIAVNNTPPVIKFEENGDDAAGSHRNLDERSDPHRLIVRTSRFDDLGC